MTVDDLGGAVTDAVRITEQAGGFVFGEDTSRRDDARTTLTLKVPPDRFRAVLSDLADLGNLESQQIDTDDVTEQVVDLESRIRTSEASVLRLRDLVDRATKVEDIALLEGELLNRETQLETLRGQLRTIEQQVDLATITVTFRSGDTAPVESVDRARPGFLQGLGGGWEAFLVAGSVALAVLGAIVPWLPVVLIAWFAVRRWRRRTPARAIARAGGG